MLLLKFNYEDLNECENIAQVYGAFGIGNEPENEISWKNTDVFGSKANVRNIFCTENTYKLIDRILSPSRLEGREGTDIKMDYNDIKRCWNWAMYSPTSAGPRYKQMLEYLHTITDFDDLPDNVIAIFTPDDDEYYETPEEEL